MERPRAALDIEDIVDYFLAEYPPAAVKFLNAVETAYAMLAAHPASGSGRHAYLFPELPAPLRFHPLKEFPRVLIYYLDRRDGVEIIRIWDASRGLDALVETTSSTETNG
jgi:toxin ParE1/3/4